MTSGDGYMCSPERTLTAGIGSSLAVEDVVVNWPGGARESFGTLQEGMVHLLIQGSGAPIAND